MVFSESGIVSPSAGDCHRPVLQNRRQAHDERSALLLASAPTGTVECLSPVCNNQWLALPQRHQNRCQAHDGRSALLLASAPPGTAECLSPVCINQWLALPQGLQNRCQAHDERYIGTIQQAVNPGKLEQTKRSFPSFGRSWVLSTQSDELRKSLFYRGPIR